MLRLAQLKRYTKTKIQRNREKTTGTLRLRQKTTATAASSASSSSSSSSLLPVRQATSLRAFGSADEGKGEGAKKMRTIVRDGGERQIARERERATRQALALGLQKNTPAHRDWQTIRM